MTPALLFDLFGVLFYKQSSASQRELAAMAGVELEDWLRAYWACRPAYDRGCSVLDYWRAVGKTLDTVLSPQIISELADCDNRSWLSVDTDMLKLIHELKESSVPLYLLSNIPRPLREAIEARHHWIFSTFENTFYSCDLGQIKPQAAAFEAPLGAVRAAHPGWPIAFIDDSSDNVAAAHTLSIEAHRFVDIQTLRTWLSTRWRLDIAA